MYKEFLYIPLTASSKISISQNCNEIVGIKKLTLAYYYELHTRPYSNFISFSSNVLFLFQGQIQDQTLHLLILFPLSLLVYNSSSDYPCLSRLWHFQRILIIYLVQCKLAESEASSFLEWKYVFLSRISQSWCWVLKASHHRTILCCLGTDNVDLPGFSTVMLLSFLCD